MGAMPSLLQCTCCLPLPDLLLLLQYLLLLLRGYLQCALCIPALDTDVGVLDNLLPLFGTYSQTVFPWNPEVISQTAGKRTGP